MPGLYQGQLQPARPPASNRPGFKRCPTVRRFRPAFPRCVAASGSEGVAVLDRATHARDHQFARSRSRRWDRVTSC